MMVGNDLSHDPRVSRAAQTARDQGYRVVMLGYDSTGGADGLPNDAEGHVIPSSWRFHSAKALACLLLRPLFFWNPLWMLWRLGRHCPQIIPPGWRAWANRKWAAKVIRTERTQKSWNERLLDQISLVLAVGDIQRVLGKAGRSIQADLYHAHDLPALPAAIVASRGLRARLVYDAHELWAEMDPEWMWWFKAWARRLERRTIKLADRCIVVNSAIGKVLTEQYGIDAPVEVLNCPSLHGSFDERAVRERKDLGLGPNDVAVLYQGRYESGRGLEQLIDASQHLSPNITVFLRGYGKWEGHLRARVQDIRGKARIRFLPPVPMHDLVGAAAFADIGVLPYRATCENNRLAAPNKLFEYMMAGLAIAASDLPAVRRLVGKSGGTWFFDPDDPLSIARTLNVMGHSSQILAKAKQVCRQLAGSRYNWETESRNLLGIYESLTGRRPGARAGTTIAPASMTGRASLC